MNHITASCIISHNTVYKNGVVVCKNDTDLAGFLLYVYQSLNTGYARFYKMDNLGKLGWLAAEILLKDSFRTADYLPEQTGLVLANAHASMDTDIKYAETIPDIPSPSLFVYTLPNIMIGEICIRHHFKGESAFFIAEQFDPVFMHDYVNNLLNNDILAACIVGWVELLEQEYKAVLYLVEKKETPKAQLFSIGNMQTIFQSVNG